ncbi:MAG: phosphoenolpyruvate carboxykinase [Omnitrophica WOR_2 bacterium SM23_29]|nr:MAG: phosphoenolpyruvate carboxykinase [Omnitrophica WOR_2 bacterium SM23_29]
MEKYAGLLKTKCGQKNYEKLLTLNNPSLLDFIGKYVQLCNPSSVFVRTDSLKDYQYIRERTIAQGEETRLKLNGHTFHFDGYFDQARDKENTKFLITKDLDLGPGLNCIDREAGLKEIQDILRNIMQGKQMYILFLSLGPLDSDFSVYAVQITDSGYVAHSEDMLYRPAYEVFKRRGSNIEFFKYVHSAGELNNNVSKNVDKRRIYIDFLDNIVYSVNTQYAGNTVGLKKLALRLAIRKAHKEKWLAEHMFVMGVHGPNNRKTYFAGAFPSLCGKTSTCMVEGETILGDDIAYLRKKDKKVFAVNVERGIFGIIRDVNSQDDPLIWEALNKPDEVIVSNILVKDGVAYWQGDGREIPAEGINFSGRWFRDKVDEKKNIIPYAHPNARYTITLKSLRNCDLDLENPRGVEIGGIIYGGRDSDTWPPVFESFDWQHGVITIAASLESETTAATLGKEGIRKFNPMANLDFLSIPIGKYIKNHLDFAKDLKNPPLIFGVNYFLKDKNGQFLTGRQVKRVWLKWMELRVHRDAEAIRTPIGFFPKYEDLKKLFLKVLNKDYVEEDYIKQFTLRVNQNLDKAVRIIKIYREKVPDTPKIIFDILQKQKQRLQEAKEKS